MEDNVYVIQDNFLVYGKSTEELNKISDNILSVVENVEYRPFNAEIVGNPCFEVGDGINLKTKNQDVQSYIMSRTLKGIQGLRDDFSAEGDEYRSQELNAIDTSIIQLRGKTNTLERTLDYTRSEITDMEKNLSSRIEQTVSSISMKVTNGETTAGIVITMQNEDGTTDEVSGTIELTGLVSFNDLTGNGTTTINGSNITTGIINGIDILAKNFVAYNMMYMQYWEEESGYFGKKIKVFRMRSNETPGTLDIGEKYTGQNDYLGYVDVYAESTFFETSYFDTYALPRANDGALLGDSNFKWKEIWCSQSSINSSSDRNLKNTIIPMSDKENLDNFFMSLIPLTYKFNNGDSGRTHFGFVSQDVEQALSANGMTSFDFGGFCKDVKTKAILNDEGKIVGREAVYDENGNKEYNYGLRYSEFIALNTHMIQKQQKIIESQQSEIDTLKEQVSFLMQEIENLKGQ